MTVARGLGLALAVLLALALGQVPVRAAAPADARALEDVFRAGIAAYDAQEPDRAIEEWTKLLRFRVEHPAVEYNLGNAYFKKKDYGRAVLHWERALRLDPGDRETLANLALARGLLVDDVPSASSPLERAIEQARRAVGVDEVALIALAAWQVLGLGLLVAILRPGALRRVGAGLAVAALLVLVAAGPLLVAQVRALEDDGRMVVLAPAVEVRSGPGEQYTTVFTMHEGLVVTGRGSASQWERVELPNGLEGWVPAEAVERI